MSQTIIAGMDDTVGDDDLKEEIMRCFSNTPPMVQAISVLRGIRQRHNEQAHLYAAKYEFIHNRAHNIQQEEQTQVSELIHYISTLLPHLWGKLLNKLNSLHQLKSLREAMDVTMDIKVEHQITQPEQQLTIMETCYEGNPNGGVLHNRRGPDEVTRSKTGSTTISRKLFTILKASKCRAEELPRKSKLQVKLWVRLQVSIQQGKCSIPWQQTFISGTTPTCLNSSTYATD